MSDTPRTDVLMAGGLVGDYASLARQLERELADMKTECNIHALATRAQRERAEKAEAERDALKADAERCNVIRNAFSVRENELGNGSIAEMLVLFDRRADELIADAMKEDKP